MRRTLRWLNGQDISKNCWVLQGPASWASPSGDLAGSEFPMLGNTILPARVLRAKQWKRGGEISVGMPLGKAPRGQEGRERRARGWGLGSSRT